MIEKEYKKAKCRFFFRGEENDGDDCEKSDEYEKCVKEEFQRMKRSGYLYNLKMTDMRDIETRAVGRNDWRHNELLETPTATVNGSW